MSTEKQECANSSPVLGNNLSCDGEKLCEEILVNEIDKTVQEVIDEVKNMENLQVGETQNVKEQFPGENICDNTGKILPNPEELKLQLEEKPELSTDGSTNDGKIEENTVFSNVQEILLEVIDQATACAEKTVDMDNVEISQEKNTYVGIDSDIRLPESSEKMEILDGVCKNDVQSQKHGMLKRTRDEASLDGKVIPATEDSGYVMSLVQEELNAVEKQLDTKDVHRIVDYDSDSAESSSSDGESSDSESTSSESSIDERIIIEKIECEDEKPNSGPPKTKDEILLNDLPPEPLMDLVLADDVNLMNIGVITSVVECVVVVRALPKTPAVDADTLLFLENRKCLGKVFETFGPVQSPFYSVRFNSAEDLAKADIKTGMMVFFAPEDLDMTKLIFTSQIEKFKGSDASWKHDQEPPDELVEYSDDEQEAMAKAKKKQARKANKQPKQGVETVGNGVEPSTDSFLQAIDLQQPREFQRTWQGRGRGRNAYRNYPRPPLPPPGVMPLHPTLGGHPAHLPSPMFHHVPRIYLPRPLAGQPPPHPGHYMPPPPPLQPSLFPEMVFQPPPGMPHGPGGPPPAMPHGLGGPPPAMPHGLGGPPPAMPPGPGGPFPWPPFNYGPPNQ